MTGESRREFLAELGRGMFVATLGPTLACELGLATVEAKQLEGHSHRLTFGPLEPLVSLLQETPPDRLLVEVVQRLRLGTDLRRLTAAAALANARGFGGEHYRGYHTFMALRPAYEMAFECAAPRRALPILKVIYRNAEFLQSTDRRDALTPVGGSASELGDEAGAQLRSANAERDWDRAERVFAGLVDRQSPEHTFNDLIEFNVADHADVHEVVLLWRAWSMLDFTGREHAQTLLRQSVRQCLDRSEKMVNHPPDPRRELLPRLLEDHGLPRLTQHRSVADDRWIIEFGETLLSSSPEQAAEATALALAEGFSSEDVGEAISLAANQLVLRQVPDWQGVMGRRSHGDSPGVHACDAVNAWRNIIRVSSPRNGAAGLILAAWFVARSHHSSDGVRPRGHDRESYPRPEQVEAVRTTDPEALSGELHDAIRGNDQLRAAAIVEKWSRLGEAHRPVFDVLLHYAVSEDGRLHGEKYYRTVVEEFSATRPSLRWKHLVGLARVMASGYGYDLNDRPSGRAPGYEDACQLLGVDV